MDVKNGDDVDNGATLLVSSLIGDGLLLHLTFKFITVATSHLPGLTWGYRDISDCIGMEVRL